MRHESRAQESPIDQRRGHRAKTGVHGWSGRAASRGPPYLAKDRCPGAAVAARVAACALARC